jgi:hypothetical protein
VSTSYVEFRGRGFWSFDPYLEHFFSALAASIPQEAPTWLEAARVHWLEQSGGALAGWMRPRFDEFASNEERRAALITLVESVVGSASRRELRATAEFVRELLDGRMKTDASSPLDYMVSGEHPYEWRR